MEEDPEEIESWCEICEEEVIGSTNWAIHAKSESHQRNVIKFLMFDIGDMTIDEIPEKVDEYFDNYYMNKGETETTYKEEKRTK